MYLQKWVLISSDLGFEFSVVVLGLMKVGLDGSTRNKDESLLPVEEVDIEVVCETIVAKLL